MSPRENGPAWSRIVRLSEVGRLDGPVVLAPDEAARARIAKALDLAELPVLEGELRLIQWLDGVEIQGRWDAKVVYRCGLTLEPFDADLEGRFTIRAVPSDSPLAVAADNDEGGDVELNLESEDPPDVLDGDDIDVGAYLVEHLALELDPFPRKPGAVFELPAPEEPESPFAVLRRLRPVDESDKG